MMLSAFCSLMLTLQLIGLAHKIGQRGHFVQQSYVVVVE